MMFESVAKALVDRVFQVCKRWRSDHDGGVVSCRAPPHDVVDLRVRHEGFVGYKWEPTASRQVR